MKRVLLLVVVLIFATSCSEKYRKINKEDVVVSSKRLDSVHPEVKSKTNVREDLLTKGFQIFDVVDETTNDTVIMQQYFVAFIKSGNKKLNNDETSERLKKEHLEYYNKMYSMGYMDVTGPFGDGDFLSMSVYNVPSLKMADSLAKADPLVVEGYRKVETHPWWAPKRSSLR